MIIKMVEKILGKKAKRLPGTEMAPMTEQEAAAYWERISKQTEAAKNVVHGW